MEEAAIAGGLSFFGLWALVSTVPGAKRPDDTLNFAPNPDIDLLSIPSGRFAPGTVTVGMLRLGRSQLSEPSRRTHRAVIARLPTGLNTASFLVVKEIY